VTEPENVLQSPVGSILMTSCKITKDKKKSNKFSLLSIKFIKGYQYWVSPFLPTSCRFYPSCSQYALESYQKLGFFKATYLSILRLLKCNPFHHGGFDAVPIADYSDTEIVNSPENN
tara:strand:- start:1620 stop:1970 length:351 start_codon:yes stop_codon:yes gene_type:complete